MNKFPKRNYFIYIYIYPQKLVGGAKEADFVNFSFSRGQCEFFLSGILPRGNEDYGNNAG